jgi:hypothetical protein
MSHAIAFGFEATGHVAHELADALQAAGMIPLASMTTGTEEVLAELAEVAATLRPGLSWYAAARDSVVDLDFVYRISDAMRQGSLKRFVDAAGTASGLGRVGVLLYDLSDADIVEEPLAALTDIGPALCQRYEHGGPLGSAYHEFRRVLADG